MLWWLVAKPPTKEETERLREGRSNFLDFEYEIGKVVGFRDGKGGDMLHRLQVPCMDDDLWERNCGLNSEIFKS